MKKYILILLWITPCLLNAQDFNPYNNIIPPNPEAASLAKYADFPVDLFSGVPQISIPLWNIKCGDINVPVSLSYHASGIPVAETPSYVGLGWTLNAGGVITRTIRGIADDGMEKRGMQDTYASEIPGILTSGYSPFYAINSICSEDKHNPGKYWEAAAGKADLEPDMFYFNFCNYTGKFVFDFNGKPHLIPRKNIIIKQEHKTGTGDKRIIKWTITTEDGLKYYFDAVESTKLNIKTEAWISLNEFNLKERMISNSLTNSQFNSAWYLTKIKMPNSSDSVVFEYDDIIQENIYPVSESYNKPILFQNWTSSPPDDPNTIEYQKYTIENYGSKSYEVTQTESKINGKRLRKIISPNQIIEFIPGDYRHDLKGDRVLDKIVIRNKENEIIKQFRFSYNYFSGSGMIMLGTAASNASPNTKLRLSLKSIQECDKNGIGLPPYTFEYENSVWLPDRLTSKAQDHWGYYNGQDENISLIPYLNSIRDASEYAMKAGSLVRINYPTGGYTQFKYEANYYGNGTTATWDKINAYCEVGSCVYNNTNSTFTIADDVSGMATVKVKITGYYLGSNSCGNCNAKLIDPNNPNTYIYLAIEGPSGTIRFPQEFSINGLTIGTINMEETHTLTNGIYKIKAQKTTDGVNFYDINSCDASPNYVIKFSVEGIQKKTYYGPRAVGGLRIKEKIDYDPVSKKSLFKKFDYNSSGYINYIPVYYYSTDANGFYNGVFWIAKYDNYTSSSNTALNNGGESIICYKKVTIFEGNDEIGINGKTENYYTILKGFYNISINNNKINSKICPQFFPSTTPQFPFAPEISGAWGCGLIESQHIYKYKDNSFSKVKEIQNTYKNDYWGATDSYNPSTDILAAKVGVISKDDGGDYGIGEAAVQFYFIPSRNINLIKTLEIDYDDNENPIISKVTNIKYENFSPNIYVSEQSITDSKGNSLIITYKYPSDYPLATNFTKSMRDANIINKPVEQYTIVNGNVTQGVLNTYKTGADLGLNDITYRLETTTPLNSGQFSPSNYQGGFSINSYYKPEIIYDKYDKGNLLQYHKANDINVSYIWGYNNSYPIAEVRNAAVNQIVYTSFEEGCTTGWTCSGGFLEHVGTNTGKKVLSASSWTLQSPTLPAGTYVVSFWAKGAISYSGATVSINGGNTVNPDDNTGGYYQKTITLTASGKITLSGGYTSIDEVRIYPSVAMMKTYTYDPLIGMTSATDENGKTTYYEYDSFGRLQYIRNQDREIVQEYKYHYKE